MCKNCGVKSCSSCNQPKFIPSYTSALTYDGPGFICGGKSDVNFEVHACTHPSSIASCSRLARISSMSSSSASACASSSAAECSPSEV